MVRIKRAIRAAVLAASLVITGCSGGGSATAPLPVSSHAPVPASGSGTLAVSITVPARGAQSAKRRARYVSAQTKSIAVTVGAAPAVNINLTMGTPGCTTDYTKGAIAEYPLANSSVQPRGITTGPDGKMWIVEDNGGSISHIDVSGANYARVAEMTSSNLAQAIAVGPDNNLWVGALYANSITDITTAFVQTVIPVAHQALRFTKATDGTLWYTEFTSGTSNLGPNVFHLNASGSLIGTSPTTGNTQFVTTGSDGNIWFSEDVNLVGKLTPAGVLTEYSVASLSNEIAAGPDGAIWFADANKLNRMSLAGVVTNSFPLPLTGVLAEDMVTGPDGALWYTDYTNGKIVRMTTNGVGTIYAPPATSGGNLTFLTVGPD